MVLINVNKTVEHRFNFNISNIKKKYSNISWTNDRGACAWGSGSVFTLVHPNSPPTIHQLVFVNINNFKYEFPSSTLVQRIKGHTEDIPATLYPYR